MVGRGMAQRGIGISAAPGQDGCAVDNQIAGTGEAAPERRAHQQHEQGFAGRRSSGAHSLGLLGLAGNTHPPIGPEWQSAGQR